MYDKKIAYLHYIKGGELLGNAGHVKVTQRGSSVSIEVYVREAYGILNGCYYIQNLGGNPFEYKINIEDGQAVYKKKIEINKNDKEVLPYGIKIAIGREEYLEAVWRARNQDGGKNVYEEKETQGVQAGFPAWGADRISETDRTNDRHVERAEEGNASRGEESEKKGGPSEVIWTDTWGNGEKLKEEQMWTRTEKVKDDTDQRKTEPKENIQEDSRERYPDMQVAERALTRQEGGNWKSLTFSVPVETYEDKWEELCKKYEVIHPFGNREEYLSLSPKDFIIFPEKYQHLVNNSFLLHGYYNYRHVILGKKEEGGKNIYYLGVPGVYYEREKMVAIMFGFEGFECGEKRAAAGGFGYYMRRVEL